MCKQRYIVFLITTITIIYTTGTTGWDSYINHNHDNECGPHGFTCERHYKVRLCDGTKFIGPTFVCPVGTFCSEESTNICEDADHYINPALTRKIHCNRNERIANPNVPGCKGYILCLSIGGRLQAVNFRCSGNTIFNGYTRTCTPPRKYKCPLGNITALETGLYPTDNRHDINKHNQLDIVRHRHVSLECKNYKFRVTEAGSPNRATYFCPPRPTKGHDNVRCTIFSNDFCVTLEKDPEDQYIVDSTPYRRPRM